jgi:periplasmic copper chaperone A
MKPVTLFVVSMFSLAVFSHSPRLAAAIDGLTFNDAWIAEAPPTSKVMVGYVTISNTSGHNVSLVKASSSQYSSIEFHETVHENKMARMIRHESIDIMKNDSTVLQRGGKHLMLFNPVARLRTGDTVEIMFTAEDGNTETVNFAVKKPQY